MNLGCQKRFMNATTEHMSFDDEVTSKLAVQIWLAEGCQSGREMEHWIRAERIKTALEQELTLARQHVHGRQN